jgi:hypothetical protein
MGDIIIQTENVDKSSVGDIVNQVSQKFRQELNKSGVFKK